MSSDSPVLIPASSSSNPLLFSLCSSLDSSLSVYSTACAALLKSFKIARFFERLSIVVKFLSDRGSCAPFSLPRAHLLASLPLDDGDAGWSLLDYIVGHVEEDIKRASNESLDSPAPHDESERLTSSFSHHSSDDDSCDLTGSVLSALHEATQIDADKFYSEINQLYQWKEADMNESGKATVKQLKAKIKSYRENAEHCVNYFDPAFAASLVNANALLFPRFDQFFAIMEEFLELVKKSQEQLKDNQGTLKAPEPVDEEPMEEEDGGAISAWLNNCDDQEQAADEHNDDEEDEEEQMTLDDNGEDGEVDFEAEEETNELNKQG